LESLWFIVCQPAAAHGLMSTTRKCSIINAQFAMLNEEKLFITQQFFGDLYA